MGYKYGMHMSVLTIDSCQVGKSYCLFGERDVLSRSFDFKVYRIARTYRERQVGNVIRTVNFNLFAVYNKLLNDIALLKTHLLGD